MTVYVIGMREHAPVDTVTDTTSRSNNWSRGLSPFFLGPVNLYDDYQAENVENAWQFAKVYSKHVDEDSNPTNDYFEWAKAGWRDNWAHRYPMGRGARPEYSFWDGEKLGYIEARKKIYIPLYSKAVRGTEAFEYLKSLSEKIDICLRDFDGYNHKALGWGYEQVINCPHKKMGHAFVLAMMLEGFLPE